jgi:hypothetical protein
MYQFFSKANIAICQGTSPEFIKLLTYCVNNAAYLKSHMSQLKIGPQKGCAAQLKSFLQTLYVVSLCIKKTHKWYKQATGLDNLPFLNIAHDIWELKEE